MSNAQLKPISRDADQPALYDAGERFVQGDDDVRDVRPELAISWQRCRDQYRVDPYLSEAPAPVPEVGRCLEHGVELVQLGFRAAAIVHQVSQYRVASIPD